MTRLLSYQASAEDAGQRLDVLLAARGLYPSRSAAARCAEEGGVFVNGGQAAKRRVLAAGDLIVYRVEEPTAAPALGGQAIHLDIRYEDDSLVVLSKQAGLVCHPSVDHEDGTLVNALIHRYGIQGLCNVQGMDDRLGIVHRLDRDTSGLMLAARSDEAGRALMDAIRERAVDRRYLALVHGVIAHDSGLIDAPIARAEKDRTRMAVRDAASAREALTSFQVLERFEHGPKDEGYTLIDCKLFTGRTHQIRVHMQYARHPLVGDPVYRSGAPSAPLAALGLDRQFLHSFRLAFDHPDSGERLSFSDRLPHDLQAALDAIGPRSTGRTPAADEVRALFNDALPGEGAEGAARSRAGGSRG